MITSFEVGSVFKIVDEASPGLRKILGEVRRLREVINAAKAELGEFSKAVAPAIGGAVKETNTLTAAWERVGQAAREASAQVVRAAETAKGAAAAATGGIAGGDNRFRPRSGAGGTGGMHVYGPGVPIPGGGHARFGGAGTAGLGLLGYGVYQAMQYDDAVALMATHAGVDLASNRDKFRKILQDAAIATGYGEHEISAAAQQELRMFKYTPGEGNGISALPTMLRLAATESRLKGTPLEESMKAETGLAHMVGKYSEGDVTKLAAAFSSLSVSNPMTLAQQERAFSYSVPVLKAGMDIDPIDTMAASTALARAGITSTKAGTWVRQMMKGAMPGTSFMSKMMFKKHEAALHELSLIDSNHKPTWFVDGKPSEMKFLEKVAEALPKISVDRRMAVLGGLAGTQGAGALAVLAEPVVQEQLKKIAADVRDPQSVARMQNFLGEYNRDSSLQNARTSIQSFNVTMAEIGTQLLPSVNAALSNFKTAIEGVRSVLPSAPGKDGAYGGAFLTGAVPGAVAGFVAGGPFGAAIGGGAGGVAGMAAQYMHENGGVGIDKGGSYTSPGKTGKPAQPKVEVHMPQQNLSFNLDGETLAQIIINKITHNSQYATMAPASDESMAFGP